MDRLSVWASAGHGAAELRSEVLKPAEVGGLSLALKGEGHVTRTESEAAANADGGRLATAEADVWMLRTGIEDSRAFALTGAGSGTGGDGKGRASITPSFKIGVRVDSGDAETGFGADMDGGLAFADPANGISLDMKARALVAHRASGFREWGASASFGWDPRPETDRGLALSLTRSLGASPSGGMEALLSRGTLVDLAAEDDGNGSGFESSGRLEGEIGYGLSDNGARDYRLGWRLISERSASARTRCQKDRNPIGPVGPRVCRARKTHTQVRSMRSRTPRAAPDSHTALGPVLESRTGRKRRPSW